MTYVRSTDAHRIKTSTADYILLDPRTRGQSLTSAGPRWTEASTTPFWPVSFFQLTSSRSMMRIAISTCSLLPFLTINSLFYRVISSIESGECPVTAFQFPALLYEEGSYDPNNLLQGLFRGHFLIRVSLSYTVLHLSNLFISVLYWHLHRTATCFKPARKSGRE